MADAVTLIEPDDLAQVIDPSGLGDRRVRDINRRE